MNKNLLLVMGLLAATSVVATEDEAGWPGDFLAKMRACHEYNEAGKPKDQENPCLTLGDYDASSARFRGIAYCANYEEYMSSLQFDDDSLYRADLKDKNLNNSNLNGTNLSGADCSGTNFSGANLGDTDFKDAIIDGNTKFTSRSRWKTWISTEKCTLPNGEKSTQCSRDMYNMVQALKQAKLDKEKDTENTGTN